MATPETFTTDDLRFFAESELITIEPFIKTESFTLSGKMYGPFRPPKKVKVPLWVALSLKSRRLCKIISPEWLSVGKLDTLLEREQNHPEFSPVPFYYFEISRMLLRSAEDDLVEPDKLRYKLQNIKELRENKIRDGLVNLDPVPIRVNNVSARELHLMRPTFTMVYDSLSKTMSTEKSVTGNEVSKQMDIFENSQNIENILDVEDMEIMEDDSIIQNYYD
ncbi:3107_t:CDS:2 [Acaulospora morrowiae]|uniref:DNA replication complex GINS protein PSF2 n=1 Tax=Acaulospora morrowiae TaxID=94023 RepID=A0A9N9F689_9GLOM|nr:3107_t:CDS:2 [Acaulospora morrowiae]